MYVHILAHISFYPTECVKMKHLPDVLTSEKYDKHSV
jgi:hypothetical protein